MALGARGRWALGVMLLVTCVPSVASAAACCLSATSFGVGRLLVWEDAAFGLIVGHARIYGEWDAGSSLKANPGDYSEGLTLVEPWAIVRLHQRIQVQAWVPVLANDRVEGDQSQLAGGLGDVGAAGRFEIASIGEYRGLPSLALTVAVTGPTGRRPEQTGPPLFAGTTGRGAWGGSLAIESEYAFLPWFVRLDAGVTAFAPFERDDLHQSEWYGPVVSGSFSAGRELVPDRVVAALSAQGEWQAPLHLGGAGVPDSEAYLFSLAASASWRVESHWTLVVSLSNSIWPDGLGRNRDARFGFNLGVRYGYF